MSDKTEGPQGEPFLPQHTSASQSIKEPLKSNTQKKESIKNRYIFENTINRTVIFKGIYSLDITKCFVQQKHTAN